MSMYVSVVRVTPKAFEEIKQDPDVLEGIFDGDAAAMKRFGITDKDSGGFDYRSADAMMETMGGVEDEDEDDDDDGGDDDDDDDGGGGESDDAVYRDLGADGELDYDAGYGPAFSLSPAAVKKAAKGSSVIELDDEVKALFQAAAKRGDYIIGIVS